MKGLSAATTKTVRNNEVFALSRCPTKRGLT